MAEINIQKKSANPMWWVLAIVAVVIVGWLLFARGGDRMPEESSIGAPESDRTAGVLPWSGSPLGSRLAG
jgi:hypothetical protein